MGDAGGDGDSTPHKAEAEENADGRAESGIRCIKSKYSTACHDISYASPVPRVRDVRCLRNRCTQAQVPRPVDNRQVLNVFERWFCSGEDCEC